MKKELIFVFVIILLGSFVFAANDNSGQNDNNSGVQPIDFGSIQNQVNTQNQGGFQNQSGNGFGIKHIKYNKEQIRSRFRERIRYKVGEEGMNITLDNEGIYHLQFKKHVRLFGFIKIQEKVDSQIDAETGEIIKEKNPWWGFLARDTPEELLGAHCGTVSPTGRSECCINKGFDDWIDELAECI